MFWREAPENCEESCPKILVFSLGFAGLISDVGRIFDFLANFMILGDFLAKFGKK